MVERGRPRAFDRDAALRRAMELFWARGYEGTTIGDLTAAMGINRPSLYASFGCKEALFEEAAVLYDRVESAGVKQAVAAAPTARQAVDALLRLNARAFTSGDRPPGCLIVLSALLGTPDNAGVRDFLARTRRAGELELKQRIERGIRDGDVDPATDADKLAGFYTAVLQGLSVQARDGADAAALDRIVDAAMAAWDVAGR